MNHSPTLDSPSTDLLGDQHSHVIVCAGNVGCCAATTMNDDGFVVLRGELKLLARDVALIVFERLNIHSLGNTRVIETEFADRNNLWMANEWLVARSIEFPLWRWLIVCLFIFVDEVMVMHMSRM